MTTIPCATCERPNECRRDNRCNCPCGLEHSIKQLDQAGKAWLIAGEHYREALAEVMAQLVIHRSKQP